MLKQGLCDGNSKSWDTWITHLYLKFIDGVYNATSRQLKHHSSSLLAGKSFDRRQHLPQFAGRSQHPLHWPTFSLTNMSVRFIGYITTVHAEIHQMEKFCLTPRICISRDVGGFRLCRLHSNTIEDEAIT